MKNIIIAIVILVALGGAYWYVNQSPEMPSETLAYANSAYGISFSYPDTYVLEEREVGNGERYHYAITLMDKVAAANIPQNGEGPPAINVDIFQNNLDDLTAAEWVENDSRSNFKLSPDGTLAPVIVADAEGLLYAWYGLYRGNSIVFAHGDNIIMLSVSYLTPDDAILSDFAGLVASFELH